MKFYPEEDKELRPTKDVSQDQMQSRLVRNEIWSLTWNLNCASNLVLWEVDRDRMSLSPTENEKKKPTNWYSKRSRPAPNLSLGQRGEREAVVTSLFSWPALCEGATRLFTTLPPHPSMVSSTHYRQSWGSVLSHVGIEPAPLGSVLTY